MRKAFQKLWFGVWFSAAASAFSMTIIPTFDGSITNDPNGVAMTNAIYAAIQVFQTNYADALVVKIHFTNDPTVGLGQSQTWGTDFNYSQFLSVLKSRASSANDTNAISKLPNSSTDPVIGGSQIYMTLPHARLFGFYSGYGPDGFDSTISLNMPIMNFTRPPTNSSRYDLRSVAEHEMDEVLGTSSALPQTSPITPADLFRYTTNLARTFITTGDNSYFSADGTNLWARYNMNSGGDYGDWWSLSGHWAPPGKTAVGQVQDAYTYPDVTQDLSTNELTLLDVVGYTLAVAAQPAAPTLKIVSSSSGHVTFSWPTNYTTYLLQECTNLQTAAWTNSASGYTNPAVVSIATGTKKFYRLYNPPVVLLKLESENVSVPPNTNALRLLTRSISLRQP